MVSIIICSKQGEISQALDENIHSTVGLPFELIVIDNSNNSYSIFEAYNQGIEKSIYPFLLFVHEDVLFHTPKWGEILIGFFRDNPGYGLLGIAGADFKSRIPSGWWDCPIENKIVNIIQHYPNNNPELENIGFDSSGLKDAVVVDGVFLALRKDLNITFNENFSGFHGYDQNISFEVIKRGFQIGITDSILIEHFSNGQQNREWLEAMVKIHRSYRKLLPLYLGEVPMEKQEEVNCRRFLEKCLEQRKKKWFYYYWLKLVFLNPVSKFHFKLAKQQLS
ncbi:hypothetical protein JRG66_01730 [Salinimicrobium tongyeongense]|uniref:Streptomycin biosynthesis protein StrF domain-containing protein n=1 Tax=Salinimicrobium tongyeongense TaxID=2809707 RepID=A0ABY6NRU7_9FLAO|nr:glycosyltransferase family protein [Salinimicrobium tongyeongense]UZH55640.1 hypothetical protein JRG66_01730 [Salinimicrobium tongyeongense]